MDLNSWGKPFIICTLCGNECRGQGDCDDVRLEYVDPDKNLICPYSGLPFFNPMNLVCGHVLSRASVQKITQHFNKNTLKCPTCNLDTYCSGFNIPMMKMADSLKVILLKSFIFYKFSILN